jgi:transcriptional regulator with XRE-family HTH domain
MKPRSAPLSEFGSLLNELAKSAGLTMTEVAKKAGLRSSSHIHYATIPHRGSSRRGLLSAKQMRALARVVKASPEDEMRLLLLAAREYLPPFAQDFYRELESDCEEYRLALGKPKKRYRLIDV